ncbi:MAG: hypothetical protein E6L08_13630 [Verrucomicrobia bacterium]|nr:MAG: hypothetical protein E6L08_13630 [Verrucomicrobiota bacterium]
MNAQDTSAEPKPDLPLEIAHVLLIDVVGYSKLLVNEQIELLQELNQIVRGTECFRAAETKGKLIRVSTGDGMALLFFHSPEEPARCALEISRTLQGHPHIQLRMGVHSGPVNQVTDVNDKTNIAGSAQRVMDCGDAGHILLSKRVAEDLQQLSHWRPHLYDLGEYEMKHGVRVSIVNLFTAELGNSERPRSLSKAPEKADTALPAQTSSKKGRARLLIGIGIFFVIFSLIVLAIVALIFTPAILRSRQAALPIPVQEQERPSGASLPAPEKSIAVLPFENLSSDKENAYFTDGVQDEILTDLAKIADLKVISRTSVMQYKTGIARNLRDIGQQLGVAHLLEGSVQRAANRVRVNAQLIDARTDAHLWGQTYDRDLADVFAIQSEVAKAIADQLQAKLSPNEKAAIEKPPTTDVTAFDLYSRAKNLVLTTTFSAVNKQKLLQAVDLLSQALARDSFFFLAQCQLAYAHDQLYFLGIDSRRTSLSRISRLRRRVG